MAGAKVLTAETLPRYRALVMVITVLGSYLSAINTTVLGLAIPSVVEELAVGAEAADWILTVYLFALAISMPVTGWLAEVFGRRRVFLAALVCFAIGTALCVFAPNLGVLLAGRFVQGLGGGPLVPLSMAMIYELFPPHRRGTMIGIWGIAIAAAPALGPPAGGWILATGSWRWIFGMLLVVALLGLSMAAAFLRDLVPTRSSPFDLRGWLTITTGLGALILVSRNADAWGFRSPVTLALCGTVIVAAMVLIHGSFRGTRPPLLDLRVFTDRTFAIAMVLLTFVTVAQFAKINFLPIELQVVRSMSAFDVGLLLAPSGLALSITMPLGGKLADLLGTRLPVTVGLIATGTSTAMLATLTPQTSIEMLLVIVVVQGLGAGLVFSPLTVIAMNAVPAPLVAQASAMTQLNRQVSAAVSTALMAAVLVTQIGSIAPVVHTRAEVAAAQEGYNSVFALATAMVFLAGVLSLWLPGKRATRELQEKQEVSAVVAVTRTS